MNYKLNVLAFRFSFPARVKMVTVNTATVILIMAERNISGRNDFIRTGATMRQRVYMETKQFVRKVAGIGIVRSDVENYKNYYKYEGKETKRKKENEHTTTLKKKKKKRKKSVSPQFTDGH